MNLKHFELTLSEGRPSDAVKAISDSIIAKTEKELEGITDPEALLKERKALREKREALQAQIKTIKSKSTKTNKQREAMLAQWEGFKTGVIELARKHGIDFEQLPRTAVGRTFVAKIQNANPEHFVTVEGERIPQIRTDALLDDEKIRLFEIEVKQELLENIIARKSKALKALFDTDPE